MSASKEPDGARSTEQRAEEIVERAAAGASRWLKHAFGRAREELEDIVAEARSLTESDGDPASASPRAGSSVDDPPPTSPAPAPRVRS